MQTRSQYHCTHAQVSPVRPARAGRGETTVVKKAPQSCVRVQNAPRLALRADVVAFFRGAARVGGPARLCTLYFMSNNRSCHAPRNLRAFVWTTAAWARFLSWPPTTASRHISEYGVTEADVFAAYNFDLQQTGWHVTRPSSLGPINKHIPPSILPVLFNRGGLQTLRDPVIYSDACPTHSCNLSRHKGT